MNSNTHIFHHLRSVLIFSFLAATICTHAQKKVGINTSQPQFELDVRTDTISDGADINIGNASNSHFLRLFSGKDTEQFSNPTIYWNPTDSLILGHFGPGFTELGRLTPDGDLLIKQGGVGIGVDSTQELFEIQIDSTFIGTVTDQFYDDEPTVYLPINSTTIYAQSFTTGLAGKFLGVEVKNLLKIGPQTTFAQLSIYDSAGPGVNLLGSTQVELCDPNDLDIFEICLTDHLVGLSPPQVYPGDVFYVTVEWVSGETIYWGNVDSGYYPGGDMWYSFDGQPFEEDPGIDFAFETAVATPITERVPFLKATPNGRLHIKDYSFPTSNGLPSQVMTAASDGHVVWSDKEDGDWTIDGDTLFSGKHLGIGITDQLQAKVHIHQEVPFGDGLWISESASNQIMKIDDQSIKVTYDDDTPSYLYMQTNGKLIAGLSTGQVGIGTAIIPDGYKLAIDGKMITEEVMVKNSINWPDYVFKEDYVLKPLGDVKAFIAKNHHLPDVPSEAEVMQNGVAVGEMQATLLRKIEELTLYLFEQDDRIKMLENRLKACRNEK